MGVPCGSLARCSGRQYGLTVFHKRYTNSVDPVYSPAIFVPVPVTLNEQPITYLLVQACQHLWLALRNEVYQQFTYIGHTIQPSTPAA